MRTLSRRAPNGDRSGVILEASGLPAVAAALHFIERRGTLAADEIAGDNR